MGKTLLSCLFHQMASVFVQPDNMLTVGAYEYWSSAHSCTPLTPTSNIILAFTLTALSCSSTAHSTSHSLLPSPPAPPSPSLSSLQLNKRAPSPLWSDPRPPHPPPAPAPTATDCKVSPPHPLIPSLRTTGQIPLLRPLSGLVRD